MFNLCIHRTDIKNNSGSMVLIIFLLCYMLNFKSDHYHYGGAKAKKLIKLRFLWYNCGYNVKIWYGNKYRIFLTYRYLLKNILFKSKVLSEKKTLKNPNSIDLFFIFREWKFQNWHGGKFRDVNATSECFSKI